MDKKIIEEKMHEFEKIIGYKFKDIKLLEEAMRCEKIQVENVGKNHDEYSNEVLALIGDSLLKFAIVHKFRNDKIKTKGEMTTKKKDIEENEVLHKIMNEENWIKYSYNDKHGNWEENIPDHEKIVNKKHDPYIEAIVAAIFYDSNLKTLLEWIDKILFPLLEKYKKKS